MISRLLRKPLGIMQQKVHDLIGGNPEDTKTKFMVYSAHDTQVDNMMIFLTQNKTSFEYVPYASQVIFELNYSEECVNSHQAGEHCFGVSVAFNGEALSFEGCTGDGFNETGCKYDEFKQYIASIWYSGPYSNDLDKACYQKVESLF